MNIKDIIVEKIESGLEGKFLPKDFSISASESEDSEYELTFKIHIRKQGHPEIRKVCESLFNDKFELGEQYLYIFEHVNVEQLINVQKKIMEIYNVSSPLISPSIIGNYSPVIELNW